MIRIDRSIRRVIGRAGLVAAGAAGVVLLLLSAPVPGDARVPAQPDSTMIRRALVTARGATAAQCELMLQVFDRGGMWHTVRYSPDGDRATAALVSWLAERRVDAASVDLLAPYLEDSDACVRRFASRMLGHSRTAQALNVLQQALGSSSAETRSAAAVGLGVLSDPNVSPQLIQALRDDIPDVRAAAAWALGRIESPDAEPVLAELLRRDSSPVVRAAAAMALGDLN